MRKAGTGKKGDDTKKQRKPITIHKRIVVPLFIAAVVQAVLVAGMLVAYGVLGELRESALNTLDEHTQNKRQNLQTQMMGDWSYLAGTQERILDIIAEILLTEGKSVEAIRTDVPLNTKIALAAVPELIARIRSNNVTGAFLILNGEGEADHPDALAGVYLRDDKAGEDDPDNADIRVLRGPQEIYRNTALMPEDHWLPAFSLPNGANNTDNDFFYQPLTVALEGAAARETVYGYWAPPFLADTDDTGRVVAYSEPLIDRQGNVLGVIGVELSETLFSEMLGKGELTHTGEGCFFLGVTQEGTDTYRKVAAGGEKYERFFGDGNASLTISEPSGNGRVELASTVNGETMHGTLLSLDLYGADSPFAGTNWALLGMADGTTLFAFASAVRNVMIAGVVLAMILGVTVAMLTGSATVRPIIRLANSLKISDPNKQLLLEPTNIEEIDCLADAIMALNSDVVESATRLTKILKLAGLSVGVFEIRNDSDTAYCSDDVFTLLGSGDVEHSNNLLPKEACLTMLKRAMADSVGESVYRLEVGENERFVRIRRLQETNGVVGAILDVTSDMENRRRLERERDYDLLTGILNRRAFEKDVNEILAGNDEKLGATAMIMLDLDNLKYLNDTYGHDCGDGYIRAFADSLRLFGSENALVARRSGDEFLVFLYGGRDKRRMRARIERAWEGVVSRTFTLPDGNQYNMRASAGVAWYPEDARTLPQLIHYADYAMYKVKRSAKGTMEEFDVNEYGEDSFLVSSRSALDRLIDRQLVRFMVQPILSAHTGETIGYELQMRACVEELPGPEALLKLADAEGKLAYIERLTWFKGLETAGTLLHNGLKARNPQFFISTIANQALNGEDERLAEEMFGSLLYRLVVEVAEYGGNNRENIERKIRFVKSHGGKIAVGDGGTGLNGERILPDINADIVKLNLASVRGLDTDAGKQALIRDLVHSARQRKIAILAEGVETASEMAALIRFGVDYLQGCYIAKPQYCPDDVDEQRVEEIRQVHITAQQNPEETV